MTRGYLISDGFRDRIERTIERVAGEPYGNGVTNVTPRLEMIGGSSQKVFRICTYTGAWSIGDAKTVSFKYQTTTPNTVSATNLFFPITNTATTNARDCAIAKDGTAWFLVDVRLAERTAVFVTSTSQGIVVSSTQSTALVTDVNLSASLNTSACTINIGKTLVTASTIFVTGTATAIFVQGTATGTYLTLEV